MNAENPPEAGGRPPEVLYALRLAFASLAVALIAMPFGPPVAKPQLWVIKIIGLILTLSFTTFLLIMILRGRNWARMLFIVLFFIGFPFTIPAFLIVLQKKPVAAVFFLAQLSLQLMAVVLLLQKPTRNWFNSIKLQKLMNQQVT